MVSEFPLENSFARSLEALLAENGIQVPIKCYGGAYKGYKSGALGNVTHGQKAFPKALKKQT